MKLRLPSLLRRLLIAATTVTGVTLGAANSSAFADDAPLTLTWMGESGGLWDDETWSSDGETTTTFTADSNAVFADADAESPTDISVEVQAAVSTADLIIGDNVRLTLTGQDATLLTIGGNVSVGTGGALTTGAAYTLGAGKTLSIDSGAQVSLGQLTLSGGTLQIGAGENAETPALTIGSLSVPTDVEGTPLFISLSGNVPGAVGDYLLVGGDWSQVGVGGVAWAAQAADGGAIALADAAPSYTSALYTSNTGLHLLLAESLTWGATSADDNTWSPTLFSIYSLPGGTITAANFTNAAAHKTVSVASDAENPVSVGAMNITAGGYSFTGGPISAGSLSVSLAEGATEGATSIANINVSQDIRVDGTELTIVQLTPTNPSAPIVLSNAAKLTIGSAAYRYNYFSGSVTGDAGSQLHLYTWQADGSNDDAEDGRVHLLDGSTVQDVYIHGHLALNMFTNDSNQTNLQGANLHMDAGSRLVVRSTEATLAPTTGDIVMHGDLSLQVYGQVADTTTLTTDFCLADGVDSGTLKKTDGGSITLSGNLAVSGVTVETGTLKLTGANTQNMVYQVNSGATLTLAGDSDYSFDATITREIAGTLNVEGTMNVEGTGGIQISAGGQITLGDGASLIRNTDGAYQVKGALVAQQNATAVFTAADDVHLNINSSTGKIELQSGSTLDFTARSLQYWSSGGSIVLNADSTLNLTTTSGLSAAGTGLNISLAAGATMNLNGGNATLNAASSLSMAEGAALNVKAGILKFATDLGTAGVNSTITLAGGNMEMQKNAAQTVHSALVVNENASVTNTVLSSATLLERNLGTVQIAADKTLTLWTTPSGTQAANAQTAVKWSIDALSGAGTLKWDSWSYQTAYSSHLVLNGDGSNFTGEVYLDRRFDASAGTHQTYVVLASENAVKNATVRLKGNKANGTASLAVDTAHAYIGGLQSEAGESNGHYAHIFAGAAPSAHNAGKQASTANNTLSITGANEYTFAGTVGKAGETEHLNLEMIGSGTQTFSGEAHVGDVSVSAGKLALSHANSVVYGDISVSGGALDVDSTYTLGAGQSLSIATATSGAASLADLVLAGGEIIFDATALSADTAALSVGTLSLSAGAQIINFTNTANLTTDTTYMLATGTAWSGMDMADFTATGLGNSLYSFSTNAETGGLYFTITGTATAWAGTNDAHAWNSTSFSTHAASVATQKALFDSTAANKTVLISENVSTGEMLVQANGYTFQIDETLAADTTAGISTDVLTGPNSGDTLYLGSTTSHNTRKISLTVNDCSAVSGTIDLRWGATLNLKGLHHDIGWLILRGDPATTDHPNKIKSEVNLAAQSATIGSIKMYNVSNLTFGVADEEATASYTVTGDITVENNSNYIDRIITVQEGAILTVQGTMDGKVGHTLTVNGSMVAKTLKYSGGTITVNGSGALSATTTTVSGGTVNLSTAKADLGAVTVSGGTLNLASANLSVTGDLIMNNAAALHFKQAAGAATTYTLADVKMNASPGASEGSITIDSGVTVNATSLANGWGLGTLTVNGALNVNGQLKYATGSKTNTIQGSGEISVGSMALGNFGTYTFNGPDVTVTGNLVLVSDGGNSTTNLQAGTMSVGGSISVNEWGTHTFNISGGTLELKNGGTINYDDTTFNLTSGALVQKGGNTTISTSKFNISGGALKVEGGKLTLSALNNVTGGAVTLSGGALDVTKELAAKLMNGAASFTMSGGVLDLADQSFTAGTAADAISLTNTAGLALNSGTLALGQLTAAGTYYLFNSGAEDVWDSFTAANVTINGENALRYGATLGYTEADGVTYATLTTTADTAGNLTLYWDGGESGTWDGTHANWNLAQTLDGVKTDFNSGDSVVFNSSATVTLSEATTAGTVSLALPTGAEEGAAIRVSLDESAGALTATAIEVAAGTTLEFATQKAGYTAENISGSGTVELSLTNASNTVKLGSSFTGETYVKSGKLNLNNAQVGSTLRLADGVNLDAGSVTFAADLILEGSTSVANGGTTTFNGTLSGDGTFVHDSNNGYFRFMKEVNLGGYKLLNKGDWARDTFHETAVLTSVEMSGSSYLAFRNNSTIGTLTVDNSYGLFFESGYTHTLTSATINGGKVHFNIALGSDEGSYANDKDKTASAQQGTTEMGTLTVAGGTVNFNGATTITTATISGGTTTFANATDIPTMTISGGTVNFGVDTVGDTTIGAQGGTITLAGGRLQLNLEGNNATQTVLSKLVVNNTNATAESGSISYLKNYGDNGDTMQRVLTAVEIAAHNTLQLEQESWNTLWTINELSGEGTLKWNSATTHNTTSRLVLGGDGSDFSGLIEVYRAFSVTDRPYQAYLEIASDTAVQGGSVKLTNGSDSPANSCIALAINTANAQMQALEGSAYTHVYAGASRTSATDTSMPASTASNTLSIIGAGATFAGTVGTANETAHLNLAMSGSGTQTFSGVAHVGDVSVSNGALVLSNESSVVHGDITVSGGSFTLGSSYTLGAGQVLSVLTNAENAVTLGGIALAGGEMVFDATLLEADTAALTLTSAATVGEGGGATVTLNFANGVLADGRYKLAGGDWSAAADGSVFTLSGLNYGTGSLEAAADGLWLNYTAASNVYIWSSTGDMNWDAATANWDNTPGTEGDSTVFTNSTADAATHAVFNGSSGNVTVSAPISVGSLSILNGAQVSLGMGADASFAADSVVVENGKLTLGRNGTPESNWSGIKDITIKENGILEFHYGNSINNTEDAVDILLQGGAINLRNGAGAYTTLHADITVDGAGTIAGSLFGGNTTVSGSITGTGTLTFAKELLDNGTNQMTVSSTISDGAEGALGLHVVDTNVKLTAANTYTGGTVIAEGGTLTITHAQAMGGRAVDGGHILGQVSGEGTLVLDLGSGNTVFASGEGDAAVMGAFTGTVDVTGGWLVVGNNANTNGSGDEADFGAANVIVRSGAKFSTHFGVGKTDDDSNTEFSSDIDLKAGSTLINIDGSTKYTGNISFNSDDTGNGVVKVQQYWQKKMTFSGLLSGGGTVELYSPSRESDAYYIIEGENNTFNGVFETQDGANTDNKAQSIVLQLKKQNAAQHATINLASTKAVSKLQLDSNATIAALNSTDADNLVTATGAYTLTVSSGAFAGKLEKGTGTLALTKQGNGTLTLSGANTYTGATTVSGGTLELAGAVSMAAESAISLATNTTLLLNATNTTPMVLGNAISGTGTIHKKGSYETVLSGNVAATTINVKDGADQATNAGTLTLSGDTVTVGTLYAAYGTVNVGDGTDATFMQVNRMELGDSNATEGNATLNVKAGSTLTVTGSNNGEGYKNASLLLAEWNHGSNLNVAGKLLAPNAKALVGDNVANITIANGGVMAVKGMGVASVKNDKSQKINVTLEDGGTLILGADGISTDKTFTGTLGAGTVGMSAATTTIAENLTLNSAEGTTFDTTQYSFVTNEAGVATNIVRGTEAGVMTITGSISGGDAKMKVEGAGELKVTGAATLGFLDVASGATATFAGGIADTKLVNGQTNPAETVVSGAGKLQLQAGANEVAADVVLDEFTGRVNVADSANLTANITVEANADGAATRMDGTGNITNTTLNLTLNNGATLLGDMTGNRTINITNLKVVGDATFGTGGKLSESYKGYESTFNIAHLQSVADDALADKLTLVSNSNTANCTIFNVQDMFGYSGDIVVRAQNTDNQRCVVLNLEYNGEVTDDTTLYYNGTVVELDTADANSSDDKAALGVVYDTQLKGIKGDDTSGVIVAGKITTKNGNNDFDSTATEHVTLSLGSWTEDEDFESAAAIKSKLNLYKQGTNKQTFTGDTTAFDGSVTVVGGELAFGTSGLKTAETAVGKHDVTVDDEGVITGRHIPQLSYGDGRVTVQVNNEQNDATLGAAQFSYDAEDDMVTISSHTPAEGQEKDTITATNSLITIAEGAKLTVDSMIISDTSRISGTAAAAATYAVRSAGSVSELTLTDSTVVLGQGNDSVVGNTESRTLTALQPMGGSGDALTLSGESNVLTITSSALSNLTVAGGSDFLVDFSYLLSVTSLKDVDFIQLSFDNVDLDPAAVTMTGLLTASTGVQLYMNAYYVGEAVPNVGSVYFDVRTIPEPTSTTLSILALAALAARRRRK